MSDSGTLRVSVRRIDQSFIVSPQGDVDLTASPVLRQELKRVFADRPGKLIVDLAGVPYMDSSGVATLVEAMQTARKGRIPLVLSGLTDRVRTIFQIAKLDTVFTLVASTDDALKV